MADEKEKIPVEEVKFLPNGNEDAGAVDVEKGKKSKDPGAFVGLTKDELMQYADDPFWVRTRKILFILFWILWVGMVAAAVIIIVLSPKCPARPDQKWWETAILYRADVRTFKDSNGDGVGDLGGVVEKLDYLVDLVGSGGGVILSSIFQTAQKDPLRRDVTNFKAVDGEIGNLESFQNVVKSLHKKGVKVILEIDPNHSSKEHPFFKSSQSKEAAYADFYVWAAAKPNEWKSVDDPAVSAWNNDATRNEFYYAAHGEALPDFNLKEEAVQTELSAAIAFWLREEGVDGFLVSGAELFVEDAGNTYQPASAAFVNSLRAAFDEVATETGKDRALIVRLGADGNATQRSVYYGTADVPGANLVVNDRVVHGIKSCAGEKSGCLAKAVEDSMKIVRESHQNQHNGDRAWFNWAISSEMGRIASSVDDKFVDAYNMLLLTLKGTPLVLYGDELGMTNVAGGAKTRSVMQWDSGAMGGFTSAQSAKFPVGADVETVNVKSQLARGHDSSHLVPFKSFTALRSKNSFAYGDMEVFPTTDGLFSFVRVAKGHPSFLIVANLGDGPVIAPPADFNLETGSAAEVVAATTSAHADFQVGTKLDFEKQHLLLQPGVGLVIQLGQK